MKPWNKKEKSRRQEVELVEILQEAGFAAERLRDQPGRAQKENDTCGDVNWPILGIDFPVECKHHGDGFSKVYEALKEAPIAFIKQDHKRFSVYCIRDDVMVRIIKLAESYRAPAIDPAWHSNGDALKDAAE